MVKTIKNIKTNIKSKKSKTYKIQSGGAGAVEIESIFDKTIPDNKAKPDDNIKVAAYCYTKDKFNGEYYFGFVRKLQENGRIRIDNTTNNGAAGTKPKFMGKWTSVGGSTGKNKITFFKAVINELNDETNSTINSKTDVDISKIYDVKKITNPKMILRHHKLENKAYIFIFEIPDNNTFFKMFPKEGRTTPDLLNSSHGEIDAVQSYSMSEIIKLQFENNNNYFIYYCIDNFNKFVKPFISSESNYFKQKWVKNIGVGNDYKARIPTELPHAPYKEIAGDTYIVSQVPIPVAAGVGVAAGTLLGAANPTVAAAGTGVGTLQVAANPPGTANPAGTAALANPANPAVGTVVPQKPKYCYI